MRGAGLDLISTQQVAYTDLLAEGKYTELMAKKPHTGSDIVSWGWWCTSVGSVVGAVCVGPMVDNDLLRVIYISCIPLAAQVREVTIFGSCFLHCIAGPHAACLQPA